MKLLVSCVECVLDFVVHLFSCRAGIFSSRTRKRITPPIHGIDNEPENIPRKKLQTGDECPHPLEVLNVSVALDTVLDNVVESWKVVDVPR